MKRVFLRDVHELAEELAHVVNVFDPWARERGEYYLLELKAQERAKKMHLLSGQKNYLPT